MYGGSNRTQDAVFKRYVLHSMKTRNLSLCLLLGSISVTVKRMTTDIHFLYLDLLVRKPLFTDMTDLETKSKLCCSFAKQYMW